MTIALAEGLMQLNLQPGQVKRVTVNGYDVEVRRVPADESEFGKNVMLQPWVWFPDAERIATFKVRPGTWPPPDLPVIPVDDEAVE